MNKAKKTNNNSSKLIFIILGLMLVAVVVAGGFWLNNRGKSTAEEPVSTEEIIIEEIEPEEEEQVEPDLVGHKITSALRNITRIRMGFIWSDNLLSLNQEIPVKHDEQTLSTLESELSPEYKAELTEKIRLRDLISVPEEVEKRNWLSIPAYNVEAPLIYASFQDFFEQDPDQSIGIVDFAKPIQEDRAEINRGNYESVPVQRLLKDGVVHLPFSTYPGELGHSFIVGHSSNFSVVQSDYNEVFKPIEKATKPGDIFYVYDFEGRKMKFEVFEAIEILEDDVTTAFRPFPNDDFPDKDRVVTLQASVLETVNGRLEPTKRWLTRGQLVVEN